MDKISAADYSVKILIELRYDVRLKKKANTQIVKFRWLSY